MFADDTEILSIPAGYAYVQECSLDNLLIKKYGDRLYVDGDLIIHETLRYDAINRNDFIIQHKLPDIQHANSMFNKAAKGEKPQSKLLFS